METGNGTKTQNMKIEISEAMRGEVTAANEALANPTVANFKSAAQVAQRVAGFYAKQIPEAFADHNTPFYRQRDHAIEAGGLSDACVSAQGFLNQAHAIEVAAPTPEHVAWLKSLFKVVLGGALNLRAVEAELNPK